MSILTKTVNDRPQTAVAERRNAGCLMYSFNEEHLPRLQERLRCFLLEDPNIRKQHQEGLQQYESIKRRVYGEGKLLRPADPPELIEKLLPQRPDAAGVEIPAILASELVLRTFIWEYFKTRLANSRFNSARRAQKLEKFRQAILALRGDLEPVYEQPCSSPKALSQTGGGSFAQSLAGAIRRAAAKHKSDRLITCQLKRHAFRKIAKTFPQQELEHLKSSLADLEWRSGQAAQEACLKSYKGSTRWRRQLRQFYEGLRPVVPVSVDVDGEGKTLPADRQSFKSKLDPEAPNLTEQELSKAAELGEHPDMRLVLVNEELLSQFSRHLTPLPELLRLDRKLIPPSSLEVSQCCAPDVKIHQAAPLPGGAEGRSRSKTAQAEHLIGDGRFPPAVAVGQAKRPCVGESWVITDQKFAPLRLNSHLSLQAADGSIFLRFEGRLKPGVGCRMEDRHSILEFELPEQFRDGAAVQKLKPELQADFKEYNQELSADPLGNRFTGRLVERGFRLRRAENCILHSRIFAALLADDALLKDLELKPRSVLCLRGKALSLRNVRALGAVMDVSLQKMSCQRVFIDQCSCLRGEFGEASFDEYSELHGYAAEAAFSKAHFAVGRPAQALQGLVVSEKTLPAAVLESAKPQPLDFFAYEEIRERLDRALGAGGLFKLLTGAPLNLPGREPEKELDVLGFCVTNQALERLTTKYCYRLTVKASASQPQFNIYLVPLKYRQPCWLFEVIESSNGPKRLLDRWRDNSKELLEPVHFHDVLFMLLDLFYREGGERWYTRRKYYFGVENAAEPRLYLLGGGKNE